MTDYTYVAGKRVETVNGFPLLTTAMQVDLARHCIIACELTDIDAIMWTLVELGLHEIQAAKLATACHTLAAV